MDWLLEMGGRAGMGRRWRGDDTYPKLVGMKTMGGYRKCVSSAFTVRTPPPQGYARRQHVGYQLKH